MGPRSPAHQHMSCSRATHTMCQLGMSMWFTGTRGQLRHAGTARDSSQRKMISMHDFFVLSPRAVFGSERFRRGKRPTTSRPGSISRTRRAGAITSSITITRHHADAHPSIGHSENDRKLQTARSHERLTVPAQVRRCHHLTAARRMANPSAQHE